MHIFEIGEQVWLGKIEWTKPLITCPVCFGNKVVTVIFGDGIQVEVECGRCDSTYPYTWKASGVIYGEEYTVIGAELEIITGVDIRKDQSDGTVEITYWFGSHGGHPDNVGATKEEAIAKAEARAAMYKQQRIEKDEKDKHFNAKSYGANAKYYLERAAQARRDVEHYERKAKVMQEKARPRKPKEE